MYDAGAMHIDARDENIFLPEQDPTSGYCVIDWQYASFHDPRSEWMLEHLAAYYIRNAPTDQRTALCDAWLLELHRQAHHSVDFESFSARVLALLGARQSVRARLQLRPAK
jgi:thiamine kinase-like enzyme